MKVISEVRYNTLFEETDMFTDNLKLVVDDQMLEIFQLRLKSGNYILTLRALDGIDDTEENHFAIDVFDIYKHLQFDTIDEAIAEMSRIATKRHKTIKLEDFCYWVEAEYPELETA